MPPPGSGTTGSSTRVTPGTCSGSCSPLCIVSPSRRPGTASFACEVETMSFELTPEEQLMVQAVRELAASSAGRAHWRERALANAFPERLWDALAAAGFLGILVPQEYGGARLRLPGMALLLGTLG